MNCDGWPSAVQGHETGCFQAFTLPGYSQRVKKDTFRPHLKQLQIAVLLHTKAIVKAIPLELRLMKAPFGQL